MTKKEADLTELDDAALLEKSDKLAAAAEALRAKGDHDGADRAATAAAGVQAFVASRRLAATEAENYARANAPVIDAKE